MELHVARPKTMASIFATILCLQGIAYGQPSTETAKVYWTAMTYPHFIRRADVDGSNSELLVTKGSKALEISLDLVGAKVYWTEDHGSIRRADLDGSGVEDLADDAGAQEIAIDGQGGMMYWVSADRIQRANLDGSGIETLVTGESGLDYPRLQSLSLDVVNSKMYWIDLGEDGYSGGEDGFSGRIRRADLDGRGAEDLVVVGYSRRFSLMPSLSLDVVGGRMYWLGDGEDRETIYRANLDGSDVEDLVRPTLGYPEIYSFTLDTIGRKMYWEERVYYHGYRVDTFRADLDGSDIEAIDLLPPRGSVFDPTDGKVYWTNGYVIQRADYVTGLHVDGFKMEGAEDLVRVSLPFIPKGIAVDAVGRKMYWTDEGKQTIDRADLDGSNAEVLVEGLLNPKGIDIDETGGKMYWTESDRIGRSDLDGSNAEVLVGGLSGPYGVTVDDASRRVYWTDRTGVQRADLDGSSVEVLVRSESSRGRRIAIDGVKGKVYWTHEDKIQLADLNGSNVETFLPEEVELPDLVRQSISIGYPVSLSVDEVGRRLFWSAYEYDDYVTPWVDYGFTAMKHAGLGDGSTAPEFFGRPPFGLAEDMVVYVPESIPTFASVFRTSFGAPAASHLGPSYPNPFNADTRIAYQLAVPGKVRLEVYSLLGQPVRTLVDGVQNSGSYEVHWDGRNQQGMTVASGVYLSRLHHPGGEHSLRLLFLR